MPASGSIWRLPGANLTVGNSADVAKYVELHIVESGSVSAFRMVVAIVDNSRGSVFISGPSLTTTTRITVGQRRIGTLQINVGTIQSGSVKNGEFADPDYQAYGEATVIRWHVTSQAKS